MEIPFDEELLKNLTLSSPDPGIQAGPVSQGADSTISNGNSSESVALSVPSMKKTWHEDVTQGLRNHLVHKLVQAIFPTPDPAALRDPRIQKLFAYARKVEGVFYESANSRDEYYHFLSEKIYKIQKELEEKRRSRLSRQLTNSQDP